MGLHLGVCEACDENHADLKPADLRKLLARAGYTPRILGRRFKSTPDPRRALLTRKHDRDSEGETLTDELVAASIFRPSRCVTPSRAKCFPIIEPPSPVLHPSDEGMQEQVLIDIPPCRL